MELWEKERGYNKSATLRRFVHGDLDDSGSYPSYLDTFIYFQIYYGDLLIAI